ncbi:chitobiosyldiphosphodolichol beta-mannosyltransferase [Blastocystis sp. ATCC 50177/Nand II]|uniref:Chitobiosyldiphosphodolichol beta-mannosyltransferase n=1 Tax=Blastocystis sp. subtype 1 (strain ATCC 50177 / NandII) TaxID=478820 RepID=A0A196S6Q3_BLAHN|nr:chitobiosyldiphosphodolichol beta-mannosyltransferase [Blastocystis sp. ATCC 50177/Nand II]OAO16787.1 chitobiosyldiphosphodolichol beta-mannosyltransferase [Blastocystis sp. ATCC 50177/Nand II]
MVTGTVVVLGDIGRSPRMQYHCLSLAAEGVDVNVVAYDGKRCCEEVESNDKIHKYLISSNPFSRLPRKLFLLYAPFKVLFQVFQLLFLLLFRTPKPDFYLVQNPPSIPTLFIVWMAARLQGARFVIDWHNFGYTIMALSLGANHPLVRIAKWIERRFGRRSDGNLCVTKAMKEWLHTEWGIEATVLYDRAPSFFHRTSLDERHALFQRILPSIGLQCSEDETLFTERVNGEIRAKDHRPALLVSSTSWTADEDFHVLLDALTLLDCKFDENDGLRVVCVVTGVGPLKAYYEQCISELPLKHIIIKTIWLEYADYPLLLGSADLGVSLHTSSSGLDLPMKVVDMFGAGLPVCAMDFSCISELVHDGENGMVFKTKEELATQLYSLLSGFPQHAESLCSLQKGVGQFQQIRWSANWTENAKSVVL